MSDLQGDRIPGEEGGNRRRFPWLWLLGGLIVLLVIIGLIAHACASGGRGQGSAGGQNTNQTTGAGKAKGKTQPAKTSASAKKGQATGSARKSSGGAAAGGTAAGGASGANGGAGKASSGVTASISGGTGGSQNVVTVPAASISGVNGWLAVQADANGRPGEVLGYAPLKPGENNNVRVSLRTPPSGGELFVTVHKESPADGRFTFPNGDPTVASAGRPVARTFAYAASGASASGASASGASASGASASGASASGAAVAGSKPLPNTGGLSPLLAGGAFATLLGAAALFLLRRRRFPVER